MNFPITLTNIRVQKDTSHFGAVRFENENMSGSENSITIKNTAGAARFRELLERGTYFGRNGTTYSFNSKVGNAEARAAGNHIQIASKKEWAGHAEALNFL